MNLGPLESLPRDDLSLIALPVFLLDDFSYYWFHRANRQIRLLWAGHVNHRSSEDLNYATALRQGIGERVHHDANVRYLARNHGGLLIIWDRPFGTFAVEPADDTAVYALTHNIRSLQPPRSDGD